MPIYDPSHVEYRISTGNIQIVQEDGSQLPAYWAHPALGSKFPGVCLLHDWWGLTPIVRRMANLFAQTGYYVIVPDLFEGVVATRPQDAMRLIERLGDKGYKRANTVLAALEQHHNCNGDVAAVGIGYGGTLAFEAAIVRVDLEAAVAYYGFPQRFFGQFHKSNTPILAFYGKDEPFIKPEIIAQLQKELAETPPENVTHQVVVLEGVGHDFFSDDLPEGQREQGKQAWQQTLDFLEKYLKGPTMPPDMKRF